MLCPKSDHLPHTLIRDKVLLAYRACLVALMTVEATCVWLSYASGMCYTCFTVGSLYLELIEQLVLKDDIKVLFDIAAQQLQKP